MSNKIVTRSSHKKKSPGPSIPSSLSNVDKPKKKIVKHSKKFVRTQTGCLQCRQKKKKCDGKRPTCLSCAKRNISCEFPANIRFFQFNQTNGEDPSTTKSNANAKSSGAKQTTSFFVDANDTSLSKKEQKKVTEEEIHFKDIEIPKQNEEITQSLVKSQSSKINIAFQKTETPSSQHLKNRKESDSEDSLMFLNSRSSSLSSNAPSLVSDNDLEEASSNSYSPALQRQRTERLVQEEQIIKRQQHSSENALSLANDGESIHHILNNITIDLIKQSISNLKYINLDSKVKPSNSLQTNFQISQDEWPVADYEIGKVIRDSLKFAENLSLDTNQFDYNFRADEYFTFED